MSKDEKKENLPHIFKSHGDLELAEYVRSVHHLWAPPGATLEQVTNVKCFVHIAARLKPNDEIIIRAEDDTFYARVLVRVVRHLDVVVKVIENVVMKDSVDATGDSEYDISYINGRYKWGFKRKGTTDWIQKEIQSEQEALSALSDHRKAIAA